MRNIDDTRLSKSLSWLLRHGAVKEGLFISPEGYVAVEQVLRHKTFQGKYSVSDIQRIVADNQKLRFKLRVNPNSNALEVRANQGHSIREVSDEVLTPLLEPKYKTVVHGTYLKCWPQIKAQGLSRMNRHHIHFAKGTLQDKSVTSGLRRDVQVYIFIDLKTALYDGVKFFESENGVILTSGYEGFLLPKYFLKVTSVDTGIRRLACSPPTLVSLIMFSSFWWPVVPIRMEVATRDPVSRPSPRGSRPSPRAAPRAPAPPRAPPASRAPLASRAPAAPQSPATASVDDGSRIHVSGYPYATQPSDLERAFAAHGPVAVESMGPRGAVLRCGGGAAAAADACRAPACVYGTMLAVRAHAGPPPPAPAPAPAPAPPAAPKRDFTRSKQKDVIVDPRCIDLSGDFHSQLDAILARVRLTQEEVQNIVRLYADLELALSPLWPGCVCLPFGSITTGLGIKTSDADCLVDIPPQHRHPQHNYVNKAKRALQQYPSTFAELLAIPRANTPIVKLHHLPTATNCDLSFKSALGARNSRLVGFLLRARPAALPAAVLLKYWAKVHDICGSGRLSNYALTMLVIFYLQQPPLRQLPAVAGLQRAAARPEPVDGWDTAFCDDLAALPPAPPAPLADIIGGFFRYYAGFDFDNLVVCPYLGRPVEKQAFKDPLALPPEFELYKKNVIDEVSYPLRYLTSICIQDPFEQCHNVACGVGQRLATDLKVYFQFAAAAYDQEKADGCRGFLRKILLEKPKIIRNKTHPEYRINVLPKLVAAIPEDDWKARVREAVFCVFEDMLKLSLTKLVEETDPDSKADPKSKEADPDSKMAHPDSKKAHSDSEKADPDSNKAHPDSKKADPDLNKAHPDSKKADPDSNKAHPDSKKADPDLNKAHPDSKKADPDSNKAHPDSKKADPDLNKVHPDSKKADPDSNKAHPDSKKADPDLNKAHPDSKKADPDSNKAHPGSKKADPDSNKARPDTKKADPDSKKAHLDSKKADPDTKADPESKKADPDSKKAHPVSKKADRESNKAHPNSKKAHLDSKKADPKSKKEKEKYSISMTRAVWRRKKFVKVYKHMSLPLIEQESRITQEILAVDKTPLKLQVLVTVSYRASPRRAQLAVRLAAGDVELFKDFSRFYTSSVQWWLNALLKPARGAADERHDGRHDEREEADSDDDSDDTEQSKDDDDDARRKTIKDDTPKDCDPETAKLKDDDPEDSNREATTTKDDQPKTAAINDALDVNGCLNPPLQMLTTDG